MTRHQDDKMTKRHDETHRSEHGQSRVFDLRLAEGEQFLLRFGDAQRVEAAIARQRAVQQRRGIEALKRPRHFAFRLARREVVRVEARSFGVVIGRRRRRRAPRGNGTGRRGG